MPTGPRIYNLFPLLAGSTRQWEAHLPRIAQLGFDWVYVNPFHYPGFSGSLYAIKDFDRLHPVVQGDASEAPDVLLRRFAGAAKAHGLRVMIDLVINHTSKDALLADTHPEFYLRDEAGALVSPSAIDPADARKVTVWGDLAEIDYAPRPERAALVDTWKRLVARYMDVGFTGFRCDAAYQVPGEVWGDLIATARRDGDAVFFAETLGCRLEQMQQLAGSGFDYFFNSAKWWDFRAPWLMEQYESFRAIAPSIAFPESHDTPRLASELADQDIRDAWRVQATYRLRYLFCAFFSTGVMMPMGFETGQRVKLDVVRTVPGDLESPLFDLAPFVKATNEMKASIPALNEEGPQRVLTSRGSPIVALLRTTADGESKCLALINPSATDAYELSADLLLRFAGPSWQVKCDTDLGAVSGEMKPGGRLRFNPLAMRVLVSG